MTFANILGFSSFFQNHENVRLKSSDLRNPFFKNVDLTSWFVPWGQKRGEIYLSSSNPNNWPSPQRTHQVEYAYSFWWKNLYINAKQRLLLQDSIRRYWLSTNVSDSALIHLISNAFEIMPTPHTPELARRILCHIYYITIMTNKNKDIISFIMMQCMRCRFNIFARRILPPQLPCQRVLVWFLFE